MTTRTKTVFSKVEDVCHAYAYATSEDDRGRNGINSVSFNGDTFYSYSTVMALKFDLKKIVFINGCSYSNTTSKQMGKLHQAVSHYDRITLHSDCAGIFQAYTHYWSDMSDNEKFNKFCLDAKTALIKKLERQTEPSYGKQAIRDDIKWTISSINQLCRVCSEIVLSESDNSIMDKHEKTINEIEEKRRKSKEANEAKKLERIKKEHEELLNNEDLQDFINKNTYSECAAFAYNYNTINEPDAKIKAGLRLLLKLDDSFSVIWFNGDDVKTSQGVTVNKSECIRLMNLYINGLLTVGGRVADKYNILAVESEYVRVGCHKISRENIEELLKEI